MTRGTTLVEVMAGLAILSTLLVTILAGRSQSLQQWARANRRLAAAEAADTLLTQWWQDRGKFPRTDNGTVSGQETMRWRTRIIDNATAAELGAQVIRLEILDEPPAGTGPCLASVDVLLPSEDKKGE